METQATPRPWQTSRREYDGMVHISSDVEHLAQMCGSEDRLANAALIVRAVNNHHALVEALEAAIPQTSGARYTMARAALDAARE